MNRSVSILQIEDDPIDVLNVRRAFSRSGIPNPLHAATTGEEALDLLRGKLGGPPLRPGVILLDLNMPGMGGLDFLRDVKADPELRFIPIVVLTASSRDRDRRRAYELGAAGYVVKPIRFEEFVRALQVVERYWALCELP